MHDRTDSQSFFKGLQFVRRNEYIVHALYGNSPHMPVFVCVLIFAIRYLLNKGLKSNTVFMNTCIFCALFGLTAYALLNHFELTHSYIPIAVTLLAGVIFYNIYNKLSITKQSE